MVVFIVIIVDQKHLFFPFLNSWFFYFIRIIDILFYVMLCYFILFYVIFFRKLIVGTTTGIILFTIFIGTYARTFILQLDLFLSYFYNALACLILFPSLSYLILCFFYVLLYRSKRNLISSRLDFLWNSCMYFRCWLRLILIINVNFHINLLYRKVVDWRLR